MDDENEPLVWTADNDVDQATYRSHVCTVAPIAENKGFQWSVGRRTSAGCVPETLEDGQAVSPGQARDCAVAVVDSLRTIDAARRGLRFSRECAWYWVHRPGKRGWEVGRLHYTTVNGRPQQRMDFVHGFSDSESPLEWGQRLTSPDDGHPFSRRPPFEAAWYWLRLLDQPWLVCSSYRKEVRIPGMAKHPQILDWGPRVRSPRPVRPTGDVESAQHAGVPYLVVPVEYDGVHWIAGREEGRAHTPELARKCAHQAAEALRMIAACREGTPSLSSL